MNESPEIENQPNWFWRILISIDCFFNVFLSPALNLLPNLNHEFGHNGETLSSVFGKSKDDCKFCGFMCEWLGWIDTKHCKKSIQDDR